VAVAKFDHLAIPVRDAVVSRDWYIANLGLEVEFEVPERLTVAVRDSHDFTLFLHQAEVPLSPGGFALYFQVADIDELHRKLSSRGLQFDHAPMQVYWGYGAQLTDPNGYHVRLWDEQNMAITQNATV
jgi:predicted enzyme related to lactoylglutathione lyase